MDINMKTIKDQFCSYEIALAMKELGFDEECLAWYFDKNIRICGTDGCFLSSPFTNSKYGDEDTIAVPLWQQCIDWFREKYNIHVSVEVLYRPRRFNKLMYCFCISHKDNFYGGMDDNMDAWLGLSNEGVNYHICETFVEARKQAILKCIELIKKQNGTN